MWKFTQLLLFSRHRLNEWINEWWNAEKGTRTLQKIISIYPRCTTKEKSFFRIIYIFHVGELKINFNFSQKSSPSRRSCLLLFKFLSTTWSARRHERIGSETFSSSCLSCSKLIPSRLIKNAAVDELKTGGRKIDYWTAK